MVKHSREPNASTETNAPVSPWPQAEKDAFAKWKRGRWSVATILWDGGSLVCGYCPAIECQPWQIASAQGEFTLFQLASPTEAEKKMPHPANYCFTRRYDFWWFASKHEATRATQAGAVWGAPDWVSPT